MTDNSAFFSEKLSKLARQAGVDSALRGQYHDNVEHAIKSLQESLTCGYLEEAKSHVELALYYLKFMIEIDGKNKNETL